MPDDTEGQVIPLREGMRPCGTGNLYAMTHGATSPFMVSQMASKVAEELIGQYPWFFETDLVGIEQYCRAEGQARLIDEYIAEIIQERGMGSVPDRLWQNSSAANKTAMTAAEVLGLTPLGRTRILSAQSMAVHFSTSNVDSLVEEGRALRAGN